MNELGSYRVVRAEGTTLRLERSDRVRHLHVAAVILVVALAGIAPFASGATIAIGVVGNVGLMIFGLLRLGQIGSTGAITPVRRSIAIEDDAGTYRGAPRRFVVVDGRKVPASDVREARVTIVRQAEQAPDIHNLYLVARGEAFKVDGSQDPSAVAALGAAITRALGIGDPIRTGSPEPISTGAIAAVLVMLLTEAGATVAALSMLAGASSEHPTFALSAATVLARLAVHFALVYGLGVWVRKIERRRAREMFGDLDAG